MEALTMANFKIIKHKEQVSTPGLMVGNITDNGRTIKWKAMVNSIFPMGGYTLVNIWPIKNMDTEYSRGRTIDK